MHSFFECFFKEFVTDFSGFLCIFFAGAETLARGIFYLLQYITEEAGREAFLALGDLLGGAGG